MSDRRESMPPLLEKIGQARAVLIAGPTASGKSTFALEMAEAATARGRGAVVVNADAMQVYDGLRVLTARPSDAEAHRVTHRLYGHVPPTTRYSVGAWVKDAQPVFDAACASGSLVILVGGTGLYFKAATEGLVCIPDIPDPVRRKWARRLAEEGAEALHGCLRTVDAAAAAAVRPSDASRVVRALEVLEATGRSLRSWQGETPIPPLVHHGSDVRLVLHVEREALYRRIEARLDAMVAEGAIDEARALLERGLDPELPVMKAIGVRHFAAFLRDEIGLQEAVAAAKQETRRYAKRQETWFRHQLPDWERIDL